MHTPLHRVPFDVLRGIFVDFDCLFFGGEGGGGGSLSLFIGF